ncbi:MAG: hypothetical protein CFE43_08995 [Burkholderiales bacterium PBB3]|nr:MAG: hypothetical protein CFE43_08995 [Burkholderiales bacterium PBB3]
MKRTLLVAAAMLFASTSSVFAADEYNTVPTGAPQYKQCIAYSTKLGWEGGNEKSPIKGQTKVQAFCTCMWNETPDDFKGNLAKLADSPKGKTINKMCEKYADWGE